MTCRSCLPGRSPRRTFLRWLPAAAVLFAAACGGKGNRKPVYPVRGQVFFEDKPTPGAMVIFHPLDDPDPNAPRPYGRVEDDGSFRLSTYDAHDGGPEGRYVITVHWRQKGADGEEIEGSSRLPGRYSSPQASGLLVEIRKGANEVGPFELK